MLSTHVRRERPLGTQREEGRLPPWERGHQTRPTCAWTSGSGPGAERTCISVIEATQSVAFCRGTWRPKQTHTVLKSKLTEDRRRRQPARRRRAAALSGAALGVVNRRPARPASRLRDHRLPVGPRPPDAGPLRVGSCDPPENTAGELQAWPSRPAAPRCQPAGAPPPGAASLRVWRHISAGKARNGNLKRHLPSASHRRQVFPRRALLAG